MRENKSKHARHSQTSSSAAGASGPIRDKLE